MEINLEEIKDRFLKHDIDLADFPHPLLVYLFDAAVQKLDYYENVLQANNCHFDHIDERVFKDIWWDQDCIVCDLINEIEEII